MLKIEYIECDKYFVIPLWGARNLAYFICHFPIEQGRNISIHVGEDLDNTLLIKKISIPSPATVMILSTSRASVIAIKWFRCAVGHRLPNRALKPLLHIRPSKCLYYHFFVLGHFQATSFSIDHIARSSVHNEDQ